MASIAENKAHAKIITRELFKLYPNSECALNHRNPFQLAIATILSAQCTDERVNIVTKDLFRKYQAPSAFASADLTELEQDVRSTGFYRNKAKSILGFSRAIVEEHGGRIPQELSQLVKLPGVGRKTANVILGTGFGIPSGVVVDTHVSRISNRLGLTHQKDAVKIEQDLIKILPENDWISFSHSMIWHGRKVCIARKPKCSACSLAKLCPQVGVTTKE